MRLRGLKFRKPWWYGPPEPLPFELEMTIPDEYIEVRLLAGDRLSMTFKPGEAVRRFDLTATRQVALKPGDGLTVRGHVEWLDCRFQATMVR